jgi:ABC-type lipoprotein export system ATPase subunit
MTDPANDTAIEFRDVSKCYPMGGDEVRAVDNVSFHVKRGERVAILGKSGSGKSTLLNLIGGLDRPTHGTIAAGGRTLSNMSSNQLADYRREGVGVIFQSYNLVATRTALENVELPSIFSGRGRAERRESARSLLVAVGLRDRADHRPAELSGGEQQRVAIARSLINRPSLLLADEPTGNLDSRTAAEIVDLLERTIVEHEMTLIVVTHDERLAERIADRVVHMIDGRIAADVNATDRGQA